MSRFRETIRDELLILEVQDGRLEALDELAQHWQGRLLAHARRLVRDPDGARDVCQDSWVAIVRGITRLRDPATFRSWAHRIVTNKCRDWVAQRQRIRGERSTSDRDEPANPPPHDSGESGELDLALASLSGEHRTILSLRYLEQMSFAEIAIAVDIPEGTVKSRLYHARNQLRAFLDRRVRRSEQEDNDE